MLLDKISCDLQHHHLYNKYKCYILCDQEWPYMINLDDILQDVAIQKKQAVKVLTKRFKANIAYRVQKTDNDTLLYFMSTQTLKDLCLFLDTKSSLLLRSILLELENIMIQTGMQYIHELEQDIEMQSNELMLVKQQKLQIEHELANLNRQPEDTAHSMLDAVLIIYNTTNQTLHFETAQRYAQDNDTKIIYTKACYNMHLLKLLLDHHLMMCYDTTNLGKHQFSQLKHLLDAQQHSLDGKIGTAMFRNDMPEDEDTKSEQEYDEPMCIFFKLMLYLKKRLRCICKT